MSTTDERIKRYVAEHSPKSFAKLIENRNMALLKSARRGKSAKFKLGCPHCNERMDCRHCLWTRAGEYVLGKDSMTTHACCYVKFGGVGYIDVDDGEFAYVGYSPDCCSVWFTEACEPEANAIAKQERKRCIAFLKGHIAWARWKCWGRKYVEEKP